MREHPLVLLIDDEEDFLQITSLKLSGGGFEVVATRTVPEAIARARELLPDLILSDIYMPPGPNGWEFALAVRSDPELRSIKFAFFTSLRDPLREVSPSERGRVVNELKDVPIFSKVDDMDEIDKRLRALL